MSTRTTFTELLQTAANYLRHPDVAKIPFALPAPAIADRLDALNEAAQMRHVWVVYTEYQNGDPTIDGVFLSQASAQAEHDKVVDGFLWPEKSETPDFTRQQVYGQPLCLACMKRIEAKTVGEDVCSCDEGNIQHEDDADWDVDVHIDEIEVKP